MEHIVQFAVGIDDEAIKKKIEEHAVEHIEKELLADSYKRTKAWKETTEGVTRK